MPAFNENGTAAIDRAIKVNRFIEPIVRRSQMPGTKVRGWSRLHVPFFHAMYSTCLALETGSSLARARGDGRMASVVDNSRSIGCGFAAGAPSILSMLRIDGLLPNQVELVRIDKGALHAAFPITDILYRSGDVFRELERRLESRKAILDSNPSKISKVERELYLIKNKWTQGRIEEAVVEFVARAFAFNMDGDVRSQLVLSGPEGLSLREAMDSLKLTPAK
jgi:hypothetical protein